MSVVKELIRTEADGGISFGDYELAAKAKKSDFEHRGDLYKVKTFKEITKLERNGLFVYESVPGTAVTDLNVFDGGMTFKVEGPEDAQITVEMEAETEYDPAVSGGRDHRKISENTGKTGGWKTFLQRRAGKSRGCSSRNRKSMMK